MGHAAEQKERTRAKVLSKAASALKVEGPDKLGVADVMKAAGLTHGGFYAHFASKDELVAEAVETAFIDSRRIYDQATADKTPREALAGLITAYVSVSHRDRRETGCVLPALSADASRMGADARARYAGGLARMTSSVRRLLQALGANDPASMASSLVAEMVGAVALARAVPDAAQSTEILRSSCVALLRRAGLEDEP